MHHSSGKKNEKIGTLDVMRHVCRVHLTVSTGVILISLTHVKNLRFGTCCSISVSSVQFWHDWNLPEYVYATRPPRTHTRTPPSAPFTQTKTHLMNVLNRDQILDPQNDMAFKKIHILHFKYFSKLFALPQITKLNY